VVLILLEELLLLDGGFFNLLLTESTFFIHADMPTSSSESGRSLSTSFQLMPDSVSAELSLDTDIALPGSDLLITFFIAPDLCLFADTFSEAAFSLFPLGFCSLPACSCLFRKFRLAAGALQIAQ